MLSNLEEQLDLTQIACKLITLILAKRKVRGPDTIGVRGPKLKNLLAGADGPRSTSSRPHGKFAHRDRNRGGPNKNFGDRRR